MMSAKVRSLALLIVLAVMLGSGFASAQNDFDEEFDEEAFPLLPPEEEASEGAGATEAAADPSDEELVEAYEPPPEDPEVARRARLMPTLAGPSGGFRLEDARPGAAGTWRMQLAVGFFQKDGFLEEGDDHDTVNASLSAAWSPIELLELYAGLHAQAASNRADFPPLLMTLGDVTLGAKMGADLTPIFSLGGDVRFELPTGGGVGVGFDGMGIGLRALATADFRGRTRALPLILRGVLGYSFDRTERLIDDVEDRRYEALGDGAAPRGEETRHLIERVERFGLQVNRTDFLHVAVGAEAPLDLPGDATLSPLLEYRWDIPVNRQAYVCPFVPGDPGDSCLDQESVAAHPMTLTLGARARMPASGIHATVAVDIGLTGRDPSQAVRELTANAPWRFWLGLGYAFDPRKPPQPPPIERERLVEVPIDPERPPEGRVVGRIVERGTRNPVREAIVNFTGREATSLRAATDGTFTTYRFPPGEVSLLTLSDGFAPAQCSATIPPEGGDVEVACEMARTLVAIEEDRVVILEKIQFALDSAEILPASYPLMEQITGALADNPDITVVEIQGHTDDQGSHEYNAQLSQQRAESVERWLTEHGIDAGRLRARGYGETVPLVSDTTEEARASNRRVEFRILEHGSND